MNRALVLTGLLIVAAVVLPQRTYAISSPSFTIPQYDMHSFGSSIGSTNFGIRASSGPIVGVASSTSYGLDTGFPAVTGSVVSLTLNAPTVDLGTLSPGSPITGTTSTTVTTDSSAGYTLAIQKDRLMTHADAVTTIPDYSGTIGTPTAYSGVGLGFSVSSGTSVDSKWGSGANFAAIPTQNTSTYHSVIQSISAPNITTITYKLDVSNPQKPGTYSASIAIFATALP